MHEVHNMDNLSFNKQISEPSEIWIIIYNIKIWLQAIYSKEINFILEFEQL
jgi:hypothetical protein